MIEIKNKQGEVIYTYDGADLRYANLYGANLRGADLYDAILRGANLRGADLYGADLRGADLRYANLYGANLIDANLRGANLIDANLRGADLTDANLRGADLRGADLSGANLRGAILYGANTEFGTLRDIMQVSNIGSRSDTTVVYYTEQGIFIKCGCFKGSLAEFEAKVKETHKGNDHEKAYLAMIELVKVRFQNK